MTLVYHNARFSCKTTERANDFHATSVYIAHGMLLVLQQQSMCHCLQFLANVVHSTPRVAGVPPIRLCCSLVYSFSHLLLFFAFSLFPHSLYIFSSIVHPSLSTRIVPLRFQAGGRRRRPNLGLVCFVHFMLSVLLS